MSIARFVLFIIVTLTAPLFASTAPPRNPDPGGHFVNFTLAGDGELHEDHPEALIDESKSGGLRLVGLDWNPRVSCEGQ